MPMIVLENVTKIFQSGRGKVRALCDVSFTLEACAFSAVIGKSGSGKSTLLNCIGGLELPDEGNVICRGMSMNSMGHRELSLFQRQHVGFVFQRGNLLSYLTVAENIGFPLALNHIDGKERTKRIDGLLERIGLGSAANALPHELSGGEIQRVAVARAIVHNPQVLLADEPTANLDTDTGRGIVQLMRDMGQDRGCTILMATHDLEITEIASSVIHLKDGRIQKEII
jgi:ABC-type lipoprotein export system ATPase subunit